MGVRSQRSKTEARGAINMGIFARVNKGSRFVAGYNGRGAPSEEEEELGIGSSTQ